ncbi:MAG: hypothetical protein WB676_28365 [Bryobacteraceae bacterium]
MKKSDHTGGVPRPGNAIHIPLKTDEALRLALKVKPTKDMPRPGASPVKKKRKKRKNR